MDYQAWVAVAGIISGAILTIGIAWAARRHAQRLHNQGIFGPCVPNILLGHGTLSIAMCELVNVTSSPKPLGPCMIKSLTGFCPVS